MAEVSFTAKDGDGQNFELAAHQNPDDGLYYPISMPTTRPIISQFADTLGTGLGTVEALGNYASITDFWIEPPDDEMWVISRMMVQVRSGSAMRAERYIPSAALTNGVKLIHREDSTEYDLTSQSPILTLAEWGSYCFDTRYDSFGAGDVFFSVRWSFNKSGTYLNLDGGNDDRLIVRLNDDFSTLTSHRFIFQGFKLQGSAG